jgi:hypothetical protein
MQIPRSHYRKVGLTLAPGQQVRISHSECTAGTDTRDRLYVKRSDENTIIAYCHNCGGHGVTGIGTRRTKCISELLERYEQAKINPETGVLELPPGCVRNFSSWPVPARIWPQKYDLTVEEIEESGLLYSTIWDRVVLPVYENGKLVYFQARAIHLYQDPKYISAKSVTKPMYWNHGRIRKTPSPTLGVTEDMLSAIKLGRHVDTVALLGTSPDIDGLTERLENYKNIVVVLDPDRAGEQKSRELVARLSLSHRGKVIGIHGHKQQPKEMSDSDLAALTCGL